MSGGFRIGRETEGIIVIPESPGQRRHEVRPRRENRSLLFRFDFKDQQPELTGAGKSAFRSAPADQHRAVVKAPLPEDRNKQAHRKRESCDQSESPELHKRILRQDEESSTARTEEGKPHENAPTSEHVKHFTGMNLTSRAAPALTRIM